MRRLRARSRRDFAQECFGVITNFVATPANSPGWFSRQRLLSHGLLLAACLWTVFAYDFSTPGLMDRNGLIKGTDFLHFYTLGTLALHGRGDLLYDMRAQSAVLAKAVPVAAGATYVPLYGPQVSLLFAPLAALPYSWALALWLVLNGLIYAACCYAVWRSCPGLQNAGWTVAALALAFPGFFHLIAWGQISGLALACFTLAYLALRRGRSLLSGLAIGCLMFKPQLGLAAAVVFLLAGEWKVVSGAIGSALLQLALAWVYYGTAVMRTYARALLHVRDIMPLLEPRPYQMHSLRAFWSLLLPRPWAAFILYLVSAVAVLGLAVYCWRREQSLNLRFSVLLLATVLVSPHLTVYDLVILAPAFLLLANWAVAPACAHASSLRVLLYVCYPLFLLGPLARYTHLQLSVAAMVGLLIVAACGEGIAGLDRERSVKIP
jgi:Glycosyltransferase family 87